jgi:structural maintenance of chromosome 2
VIAGFDPHFNAITGLNGSGKSNILDSICFVLGITNLSQVRAGNLSELVYKQGQAGVNKAVVTIVFDNNDTENSPVGYEQNSLVSVTRQVLIGGKSKYLINGHTAQAGQVQNLFHSVQLNVNNPHFLIMQGRITKVLNMKPDEILGMVEEAAGTRMYESKKQAAMKTIEKKQLKVDELKSVLDEEITPTLEKLRGEKQHYLKWSKNNADIERIERFVVAYDYCQAKKTLETSKDEVAAMKKSITEYENTSKEKESGVSAKDAEINDLKEKLSGEVDSEHKSAKKSEEDLAKELVKAKQSLVNSEKNVVQADNDIVAAEQKVVDAVKAVEIQNIAIEEDKKNGENISKAASDAAINYSSLQNTYQNMCAGISSDDNNNTSSLPDQIAKAHEQAVVADSEMKQASMRVDHLGKSVLSIKNEMKKEESNAKSLNALKNTCQDKVDKLQVKLDGLNFSEDDESKLYSIKNNLENKYNEMNEVINTLSAQLEGRLAFNYRDPVKGFDRSKVKGLVANLVNVSNSRNATALEVVAGGKLFQVVVDEATTGKAILANGKLQRRVTIIPLDKISSRCVSENSKSLADSIANKMGTTSTPAIELVGFGEDVRSAIEYVFGNTLIVDGMEAANKICDATKTKTVTIQGDVYDPSGTISGGSNKNLGSTLGKLSELAAARTCLVDVEKKLLVANKEWSDMRNVSDKYGKLSDELELSKAELSNAMKHISQTKFGMLAEKYESIMAEVSDSEKKMAEMDVLKTEKWNLYNDLKSKEKELTMERENKLKGIEAQITDAKKLMDTTAIAAQKIGNNAETLRIQLSNLESDVVSARENVEALKKISLKVLDDRSAVSNSVDELQESHDAAKALLDIVEAKISDISKELKKLGGEKNKLKKEGEVAMIEAKKMIVAVKRFGQEKGNAEKFVKNSIVKHPWIESEKEHFGVKGGDYDFEAIDPIATTNKLKKLKDEQNSLSKKINKKVMGMIEKAEGEYTDLLRKKKVIENDKKKIEGVIDELDKKKKTELTRTYTKVNRDFGSIFSTLLPGTMAKLEPPTVAGKKVEIWEGLEVKVAFGDVWKHSLTELSGGQRSLLALSLILSMLLFKPAPMYILDEVDAALDLSHTQNIGNMLRTHFSQSQFIVVSLKEGMFNNANTIFRTKFVDGVSTVTRTIGIGASERAVLGEKGNAVAEGEPAKKKTATGGRATKARGAEN